MRVIIDKCNKCGKIIAYGDQHTVTCKHLKGWEHDTKRYLCGKCYNKFQKYMEKKYNNFFSFLIKAEKEDK